MKLFRKVIKLLPPAFLMRIWLDRRYGIKVPPAPGGKVAGFVLAVLPYAFTAALSVRVESDRRLLKYFLPYGRMKRFVRLFHNMQVGNDVYDRGAIGKFRAIMPYGLVLWWDAENGRRPFSATKTANMKWPDSERRLSERARLELELMDRVEAMTLRLLIANAGRSGK